jgi:hypothetical protein
MEETVKDSPVPKLGEEASTLLSEICFGQQDPLELPIKAVIIFSSSDPAYQAQCIDRLRYVCRKHTVETVYISGEGSVLLAQKIKKDQQCHALVVCKNDKVLVSVLQQVTEVAELGIAKYTEFLFIARAHMCGRYHLTLEKVLPRLTVRQSACTCSEPEVPGVLSPTFWYMEAVLRSIVWKEFLRIKQYGEQGIISYPSSIAEKVTRVLELTATPP